MGIGGETAGRVAAQGKFMRNFSGEFRFVFAAVGALAAWRERRVRVSVDGRTVIEGPMNLAAVANGLYAGGGMMFSPDARIDDGKLDVVTASGLTRTNVVTELSRIHTGGHVNNPKVTIAQGTIARIETLLVQDAMPLEADGNVRGVTPVQFQVLPAPYDFVWPQINYGTKTRIYILICAHPCLYPLRLFFHCCELGEAAAVAFFAGEPRGDECADDFEGEFYSDHARSQTKDVAVVVFA